MTIFRSDMDSDELLAIAESLERGAFEGNQDFYFHHVTNELGEIVVSADQGGLREFAVQILRLIAKPYFEGIHCHFDVAAFSDEGSQSLVVTRVEKVGSL